MPTLIAVNLLAVAMAAQGGTPVAPDQPAVPMDTSWAEYHLAAVAQPGDALSDFVLAKGLSIQLMGAPENVGTLPESLRSHIAAERDRLMARADAELMDEPAQLALRLSCGEDAPEREHCDDRSRRLAELDPDNAHTAMALMSAAWSRKDDAGFLEAAALGARARHYTPVVQQVFASLKRRFEAIPDVAVPGMPRQQDDLPTAGVAAMAVTAAVAMPAYQGFSRPCRESEGELRAHCAAIARRLLDSDVAALDVLIGAGVLQAIGDETDRLAAAKRKRQVDWLVHQAIAADAGPEQSSLAERERYFATYAERGELSAMRELLQARGIAIEPPADWAVSPAAP